MSLWCDYEIAVLRYSGVINLYCPITPKGIRTNIICTNCWELLKVVWFHSCSQYIGINMICNPDNYILLSYMTKQGITNSTVDYACLLRNVIIMEMTYIGDRRQVVLSSHNPAYDLTSLDSKVHER